LLPHIKELKKYSSAFISAYPNAGLPNAMGQYDETPNTMVEKVTPYLSERNVQILGGCCGTTPAHIQAIAGLKHQIVAS
jgi:5-methyltetrahydrofolate--homocysteine methyltransferase